MKRSLYIGLVLANLLLVLAVVNGAILRKQGIVEAGRRVVLKLAPVDPRSLMQGDYMVLNYALSRDQDFGKAAEETRGHVVLSLGENDEGTFNRIGVGGEVGEDEAVLNYRKWRRGFRFGIESFFFEEGSADRYQRARYAELRVSDGGEAVIVNLLEDDFSVIDSMESEN
tara:strand:- start:2516 stop:3025 length:510 start_codon:yes stop_codon:yes gene_type:complete